MVFIDKYAKKEVGGSRRYVKAMIKSDLHLKHIVWWDWKGMVYWEMLEKNSAVN